MVDGSTSPITNSSLTHGIALDPFGGSGSTLIACEQTDRVWHMVEMGQKFCDAIVNRYIEQVGREDDVAHLRNGGAVGFGEVDGDG